MSNVLAPENSNDNLAHADTHDGKHPYHNLAPPQCDSHGRALQIMSNGHNHQDSGIHTPSDASGGSAPSTAPGSPHLLVSSHNPLYHLNLSTVVGVTCQNHLVDDSQDAN